MTDIRGYKGPLPHPDFRQMLADESSGTFFAFHSGEFTVPKELILGVARLPGRIKAVHASVGASGKRDSTDVPKLTVAVYINTRAVCKTNPAIAHVSGEASQQKTTFEESADTGITNAVIGGYGTSGEFVPGDIIRAELQYSGNTSPTTKIKDIGVLVEVEPFG
jgi:exosome complex RNA-binding protein Csl4